MYWRVGNGQKVNLWKYKWTPFYLLPQSNALHQLTSQSSKVSDLIDEETNSRNKEKLFQLFQLEEAEEICSIPLSRYGATDHVIWKPSKKWIFSIKSAYHLECDKIKRERGENSTRNSYEEYW